VTVVPAVSTRIDYSSIGERRNETTWKTRRSIGPIILSIHGRAARRSLRDAPTATQNAWIHVSFTAKRGIGERVFLANFGPNPTGNRLSLGIGRLHGGANELSYSVLPQLTGQIQRRRPECAIGFGRPFGKLPILIGCS